MPIVLDMLVMLTACFPPRPQNDKKDSSPPAPLPGNKYRLRHHKVLARSEVDGFYYPGLVSRCLNTRYVEVDFNDFDRQVGQRKKTLFYRGLHTDSGRARF